MAKVKTITLGCRLNSHESEAMQSLIQEVPTEDSVVLINTCAVTQEAERQSKQAVRKSIRENPDAKVIVTGCAAKTSKEYFENLEGVSKVIQNEDKNNLGLITEFLNANNQYNISNYSPFANRARAFIQIQNGCDNHCSFCIVPYTRGPSRSLPLNSIVSNINSFVDAGFREIVLSGIDISSYGKDVDENIELADVVEMILEKFQELPRIRISSIDPGAISERLFKIIANEKRIMPHLHLSIQSGDNKILRMMRRRHTREDVINFCHKLKSFREDFVFGADLIAGFPGETTDMFKNTLELIEEAGIPLLHVFPYSMRTGTLAATFLQLPSNVIHKRADELRKKSEELQIKLFQSFVGKNVNFIVEKVKDDAIFGKTDHFLPVRCKNSSYKARDVVLDKRIISVEEGCLIC